MEYEDIVAESVNASGQIFPDKFLVLIQSVTEIKMANVSMSFHILAVFKKRWPHFASEHFSESSQRSGSRTSTGEAGFEGRCNNSSENFFNCRVLSAICCCRLLCNNLLLL